MAYYTTVKLVNKDGRPVKAEIRCSGISRVLRIRQPVNFPSICHRTTVMVYP